MIRNILFSVALTLAVAPQVQASVNGAVDQNDNVMLTTGVNSGVNNSGGPFGIVIRDDAATTATNHSGAIVYSGFTFCVQKSEFLTTWNNLDALAYTTTSIAPKTLTGYAAWAFEKFLNSPISADTAAGIHNVANASKLMAVQSAIWAGMVTNFASAVTQVGTAANSDYSGNLNGDGTAGTLDFVGAGVSWNQFLADTTWLPSAGTGTASAAAKLAFRGDYKLMNLSDGAGTNKQDQIVVKATPLSEVPEPASLIVWSLLAGGAAGLGVVRKRRGLPRGRWSNDSRSAILAVVEGKAHQN